MFSYVQFPNPPGVPPETRTIIRLNMKDKNEASLAHPSMKLHDDIIWHKNLKKVFPINVYGHEAYSNGILVYDILENNFFWSDPMPIDIHSPMTLFYEEDKMLMVGGESSIGCAFGKAHGRHMDTIVRFEFSMHPSYGQSWGYDIESREWKAHPRKMSRGGDFSPGVKRKLTIANVTRRFQEDQERLKRQGKDAKGDDTCLPPRCAPP